MTAAAANEIGGGTAAEATWPIVLQGVRAGYGRRDVLNALEMHVPPGGIYGLVGPNGSGKTTLFRVLATLLRPKAGTVLVDGIDARAYPGQVREHVGYLPDLTGLYDNLTTTEYLSFYARSFRIPLRRRRQLADELLELVDLTGHRNEPVTTLSRGLQQRLGLARCLLHDPSVLLLDEPASGMDWQARRELRDVLRELTRLGKTTLLASHVLPEISELCTEMGVMLGGRLVAEGTPSEIAALGGQAAVLRIAFVDASDREAAARLIEERQGVESLRPDGASGLLVGFDGGPREQAELLESVVRSGLQVARFGAERPSLEDAYLTLTAPEEDPA